MSSGSRIIAQRITTGEFLDQDLPLQDATVTSVLSGPGAITGTASPVLANAKAEDGMAVLDQWSTILYVETDGHIDGGALVTDVEDEGQERRVTTLGMCGYCTGIPYLSDYQPGEFEDPLDVYRNLWKYAMSFPNSKLALRLNTTARSWMRLSSGEGPYRLNWFEQRDIGGELENIASAVPFDFVERHSWADSNMNSIVHDLDIGFPRLGRRREDLAFEGGVNVYSLAPVVNSNDRYANEVLLLGPGEGRAMLRADAAVNDGRLRRVAVVPYKQATQGFLQRRAPQEVRGRAGVADVASFTVIDTPDQPASAVQIGDDVRLRAEVPWRGLIDMWLRVTSVTRSLTQPGLVTFGTTRSEYFTYADAVSPSGQPEVLIL